MPITRLQTTERDPLWRREMRERWRRSVTLFFLAFYAIVLGYAAYSQYRSIVPQDGVQMGMELHGIGHQLFVGILNVQILTWIPCALLLGAPTIAAERERHALTEYLLAGLNVRQIVRAKFTALAIFVVAMCAIPLPVLALCFPLGGVDPLEFVGGFALEVGVAATCAALGMLVSTHSKRVPKAMQNAISLSVVLLAGGAMLMPGALTFSPTTWLVLSGLLAWLSRSLVASCEDMLHKVAQTLELEEHGDYVTPFSFAPLPESHQFLPTTPSNVDEVETPRFFWDELVEKLAVVSPIALREVRIAIRAAQRRIEFAPPQASYIYSLWSWVLLGVVGGILAALFNLITCVYLALTAATFAAVIVATLNSSAAFTREREQRMVAQLRVCALSPLEIVIGKLSATLLVVARNWGGPFLALLLALLTQGIVIAFETTALVLMTLLFATSLATLLSLVCYRTAVAASSALSILFVVFILLPLAPGALIYYLPILRGPLLSFPLGPMWIEPMSLVRWSSISFPIQPLPPSIALLRIICSLTVLTTLLMWTTVVLWSRGNPDGEANSKRNKRHAQ